MVGGSIPPTDTSPALCAVAEILRNGPNVLWSLSPSSFGAEPREKANKLVKRVWFTSPNDYLEQLAEWFQETVDLSAVFLYCEGRFLQTHGPLLGRLDRVVFAELLKLYIVMGDAPKRVLLDEGCEKCMVFKPICGEFLRKRRIAGSIPVTGVKSLLQQSIQSPLGKAFFFVNYHRYD